MKKKNLLAFAVIGFIGSHLSSGAIAEDLLVGTVTGLNPWEKKVQYDVYLPTTHKHQRVFVSFWEFQTHGKLQTPRMGSKMYFKQYIKTNVKTGLKRTMIYPEWTFPK